MRKAEWEDGGVRYYGERARARPCQHRDHGTANKDGIHGGEAFDPAGLGVTAKYSGGQGGQGPCPGEYTLAPDMGTAGTKPVTVTYEEGGVRKTAAFDITVNAPGARPCQHRDHGAANKDGIHGGEAFDPAGLGVTAKYSEGGADKVLAPRYTLSAPDMGTAGTKTRHRHL